MDMYHMYFPFEQMLIIIHQWCLTTVWKTSSYGKSFHSRRNLQDFTAPYLLKRHLLPCLHSLVINAHSWHRLICAYYPVLTFSLVDFVLLALLATSLIIRNLCFSVKTRMWAIMNYHKLASCSIAANL